VVHEPDEPERWRFQQYQDQTTVVMGMLSYVERLMRECEAMREYVRRGFSDVVAAGGLWRELEG
jgi:hypothetical protein